MTMDVDDDGWTDEDDNETLVKEANRVPLSVLQDVIHSVTPRVSLIASDGYFP